MGNDLNRHFSSEDAWTASQPVNPHVPNTILSVTREIQWRPQWDSTSLEWNLFSIRKRENCWWGCAGTAPLGRHWCNVKWDNHCGKQTSTVSFSKGYVQLWHVSVITLRSPEKWQPANIKTCTHLSRAALRTVDMKPSKSPSTEEQIKIHRRGYSLAEEIKYRYLVQHKGILRTR